MSKAQKTLNSLIQLLALSGGRDKCCRIIQYFCKYLTTKYQEQYNILVHQRDVLGQKKVKSESLMGAMSMTRKVLRFGPSINTIKTVINNLQLIASGEFEQPLIILILKTMSAFFLGMFLIFDHYVWLCKIGLANNDILKAKFQFLSAIGWCLDCFTNLLKNILLFNMDKKPALENYPLMLDTLRVVCDIPVSYSFVKPGSVDGKVVGLLGTLTSAIGIYQMWK